MRIGRHDFRQVWLVDFEFAAPPGERPDPICVVAHELTTGRTLRLWQDDLKKASRPPYPIGPDCLFVAYYASAELGCHLALGWPLPDRVLDLFAEFRTLTNGRSLSCGAGLLGALTWFGLDGISAVEKEDMRTLALRGGPWAEDEMASLLAYCSSDVESLAKLFRAMERNLDLPRALLRGSYMKAAAHIEYTGIPIDVETLAILKDNWTAIQDRLIDRINPEFGVYDGRSFRANQFSAWLIRQDIPWPRLGTGSLALDDETFKAMACAHPRVAPLRELREALSQMRLADLAIGSDGRNRCLLSAFRARTGRNQPSNARFIFGMPSWLRSLIRPDPGTGLAYVDWSQQEFGIAAALSRDPMMITAYQSGDPYLEFAKQAGAATKDATKATHGLVREQFKACALAVQYGMGPDAFAIRIAQPPFKARELLRLHRETYAKFWRWSDAAVDCANLHGTLRTVFGWTIHSGPNTNSRSVRNFPMQANGAEMLRLACSLATDRGIRICAPVHDALLIEAPLHGLDHAVEETQRAMGDASALVLDGFRLRTDVKPTRYPDRFDDARGRRMWTAIRQELKEVGLPGCVPSQHPEERRGDMSVAAAHTRSIFSSDSLVGV